MKGLDDPIEVKISEWNTGGLLTRIEVVYAIVINLVFSLCICLDGSCFILVLNSCYVGFASISSEGGVIE